MGLGDKMFPTLSNEALNINPDLPLSPTNHPVAQDSQSLVEAQKGMRSAATGTGTGAPTGPGGTSAIDQTKDVMAETAAMGQAAHEAELARQAALGNDRGGMQTNTKAALNRVGGAAGAARDLGQAVLTGKTAKAGLGAPAQQDVLDQVLDFANRSPSGQSQAALQLQQASQGNMADVLSAARSGRARDAGSQARAMNVAQGEIAGLGVDAARNAAMLRAQEEQDFRNQQLSALGLGGDVSGAMRGANIQERGQTLDFTQGQQQIGAGLEGDVLSAIPQIEQIRHADEFDLTPTQKLEAARLGRAEQRDPTTADYAMALLGDVLPLIPVPGGK